MSRWRTKRLRCGCCGATFQTLASTVQEARRIGNRDGWSTDDFGKKDYCPECYRFQCGRSH